MAISKARFLLNGTWYNLTLNSGTGKWEATVTAPTITSFNLANKYYPITIEATNTAGTASSVTSTDPVIGPSIQLRVEERIKPVAVITSPSAGAYVGNNKIPITANLTDEVNGSGVKIDTLQLYIDSTKYTTSSAGVSTAPIVNGYSVSVTPQTALVDGSHTVTVTVEDNDGNIADTATVTFKVDTVPPVLNVSSPIQNLVTASKNINVVGTTNDVTSSPIRVEITLNAVSTGAVTVDASGNFTKGITLAEGANVIVITSTDAAEKVTTVTRNVVLDTTSPEFGQVTITPNPVDAGASLIISVEVS